MILQCSHIDKSFVGETVLSDISFHINEQEKAAIVGVNGSGKSTLIKIIMGQLSADSGDIILSKDTTVGYLAQNQEYASDRTILEEMQDAKPEVGILERKIASLSAQMNEADGKELEALIKQFDHAQHRFDQINGYAYQSELVGVLKGLGFENEDFDKKIASLSGGEKTRVALAKMLLTAPDLIILDEPTNHLDLNAIHWLEGYLAQYNGAVLIVAHDRYFLDKIVSKVIEIRQTKSRVYLGNYTEYTKKRQEILDSLQKQYLNQQAEIKHQEEVIAKLKQFNREKSIKRAESREKMLDKIERIDKPIEENTKMHLLFTPKIQSGNDVLTVKGLSKRFADHVLFENIDFEIKRGEHVAIIGDNGSGKTTILKMINDLLTPDSGTITLGTNVEIGYYDQEHHVLHMEKTLFEEIQDEYPNMTNTEIRNLLAAFLFTEDDVFKQIKSLSGGERGRVSLAKLMLSDANFLILDEPTNHLDIDSKAILENAINHFEGTVLYVSHDRYFINTTAHRILDLTSQTMLNYIGNYDYYLDKKDAMEQAHLQTETKVSDVTASATATASDTKLSWQQQKEEQARQRKLEKELQAVETEIEELESDNEQIDTELSDPANGNDVAKLQELSKKRAENDARLEELMQRWESLSE
ncbi:ribosomal protection-like ABC-F family protein [Jutongia hominis]|uniref:ABC-F family ATP-binding cassette domain-containing protein n=1 Tax=Jutongia hominis TaxID=2763664 RepID=A0ABR7MY30_9FIRM|nr:ABC-F family ATP-binding cassette domain-containing protein [Jutongia hominis]MBC8558098.1 ABC-F family ATP-binding cassette domain-containing protein [Jutongia hominis]